MLFNLNTKFPKNYFRFFLLKGPRQLTSVLGMTGQELTVLGKKYKRMIFFQINFFEYHFYSKLNADSNGKIHFKF